MAEVKAAPDGRPPSCDSLFATSSASRRLSAIEVGQLGDGRVELRAVDLAVHIASKQGFRLIVEDEPFKAHAAACVVDSFLSASTLVVGKKLTW
jgi:hypothetical protein